LRLINASGATTFRLAIAGHQMAVSHADGRPVEPVTVNSIIIAAGERYDVIVDSNNPGTWALLAVPLEGNVPPARAVIFRVGRALKDTAIVPPHMGSLTFDFVANNPGQWFFHCHNVYHMESGMGRVIRYAS
jgi:FtsP/CotA-like multicopper oxidase with cupredoxin domain